MIAPQEEYLLASGVLAWWKQERTRNRYGSVCLYRGPYGTAEGEDAVLPLLTFSGRQGQLIAVVRETRRPQSIIDVVLGLISPKEPPPVGSRHVLGQGTLFSDEEAIGLRPDDDRTDLWLDPEVLYLLVDQTVDLFFAPGPQSAVQGGEA